MRRAIVLWAWCATAAVGAAQTASNSTQTGAPSNYCTDASGTPLSPADCVAAETGSGTPSRLPVVRPTAIRTLGSPVEPAETTPKAVRHEDAAASSPLAPERPTEFQQFIAESTGKLLPLFGADLFEHVPSTFAPVEKIPVTADYVLGPGDELIVRVWGQVNLNLDQTVDRTGEIFLPQVGNVAVAGLAYSQIRSFLHTQFERVYRNFDINVTMGQLRSIQVLVVGQARRPGMYTVSALSTLINALFACGGPSAQGSMRSVRLMRAGAAAADFDLYDVLLAGDRSHDVRLMPGDVIHIGDVGRQAAIFGSIERPGIYELRGEQSIGELIHMAGGLTPVADSRLVKVERLNNGSRVAMDVQFDEKGSSTILHNGDLVRIAAASVSFENAVTLRGNVANPGRFAWHKGMRLRDIIPDKESLVTRAYWEHHNLLGFTAIQYPVPGDGQESELPQSHPARFGPLAPPINWSYAVIERRKPQDLSRELVPFHLGRLVLEGDSAQNYELDPGDIVTIFSQKDLRVPVSQQVRQVWLEGEFRAPGVYDIPEGETLGHLIQRVGGLTPDAYLYGAQFTRESAKQEQQERLDEYARELEQDLLNNTISPSNPLQAFAGDTANQNARMASVQRVAARLRAARASGRIALGLSGPEEAPDKLMNVVLKDGDRFFVPVKSATVNVLGSVYNSGSLLYNQQWRVKDYMKGVGGVTRAGDASRAFLIRADGTVVSKQSFGRFGPSFEMAHVYPGDSIVVPEAPPKTSWFRGLRDWTEISSQLALAGAAINVLR